jgi:hypothetical protein
MLKFAYGSSALLVLVPSPLLLVLLVHVVP